MPVIGLGVFENDECVPACVAALKCGYRYDQRRLVNLGRSAEPGNRHIDSARYYQNEDKVGQAIRESGIPREQVFVSEYSSHVGAANATPLLDCSRTFDYP